MRLTLSPLGPGPPVNPTGPSVPGDPIPPARPSGPESPLSPWKDKPVVSTHSCMHGTPNPLLGKNKHVFDLTLCPTRPSFPGGPSAPTMP